MSEHFDAEELSPPHEREAALMGRLPRALAQAKANAPAWRATLADVDPEAITSREALARLPVTRKSDLMAAQAEHPPFGGYLVGPEAELTRVFVSPGPVYVAQSSEPDPWGAARALRAAGARPGDVALNTFGYHVTPGAFILESGLAALGCPVFAAGPGNTEALLAHIAALRPTLYCGVPDFLNIILERAGENGADVSSLRAALVSGAALPQSLRERIEAAGVTVSQCYATADLGVIAYESAARAGLIINEGLIVEIVRPGTGEPLPEGEVGEVVVTRFDPVHPLFRFATGDLSAVLPGESPCGRTNLRIKGWMGRADQRTKVKGMFVDPQQIAALMARHPEVRKARLVVSRAGEADRMTLRVEGRDLEAAPLAASLKEITGLSGEVELMAPESLPNDGKVIADERPVEG